MLPAAVGWGQSSAAVVLLNPSPTAPFGHRADETNLRSSLVVDRLRSWSDGPGASQHGSLHFHFEPSSL